MSEYHIEVDIERHNLASLITGHRYWVTVYELRQANRGGYVGQPTKAFLGGEYARTRKGIERAARKALKRAAEHEELRAAVQGVNLNG